MKRMLGNKDQEKLQDAHQDQENMEPKSEFSPGRNAVDITLEKDGGVLKEILKEGIGEANPLPGDSVTVHYVGTLTNGDKFDSSRDRKQHFQFEIGKGKVIKAWDLGVATMKKGEVAVLTCKPEYAYGETGAGDKIPPNATLVFEVELFSWQGEDITAEKDGGVRKSRLRSGEGYETPNDGALCKVHVVGRYNERTFEERDVQLCLGEGSAAGLVDGLEMALAKMNKGETARLFIKSQYGFGSAGNPEFSIPAGAPLEYDITLQEFEKTKESWEMDFEEKLEQVDLMKTKGTKYFQKGSFKLARRLYEKGLELGKEEDSEASGEARARRRALLLACRLNTAMCCLKQRDNLAAREHCDAALELEPASEKALFRRATALMNLADFPAAIEAFERVLAVAPSNKAASNQLLLARRHIKAAADKDKKTFAGMFQKFAEIDAKKEYAQSSGDRDVFTSIRDWDNKIADGYLPLEKEMEAFGEKMPEPKYKRDSKGEEEEHGDEPQED